MCTLVCSSLLFWKKASGQGPFLRRAAGFSFHAVPQLLQDAPLDIVHGRNGRPANTRQPAPILQGGLDRGLALLFGG
jgi:hypothetical protein